MEFKGPLELHLPASREVNMKVPRNVDTGSLKKIILDKVGESGIFHGANDCAECGGER